MLFLLLLNCFSRVRLCATPEMAAHQAPPSLGFSQFQNRYNYDFPHAPRKRGQHSLTQQQIITLLELK